MLCVLDRNASLEITQLCLWKVWHNQEQRAKYSTDLEEKLD